MDLRNKSENFTSSGEESTIHSLPDEVLIHIIRFIDVPSRYNVGLVCQKFYELLCIVEHDNHPLDLIYNQIADDGIYDSLISSSRQFNELTINLKHCRVLPSENRVESIVRKFGRRLKKFKLFYSDQSELSKISETQLVTILNCLPNAEEIILQNIYVSVSRINGNELNLHKLKSLRVDECWFARSLIFDKIPADVLHDLVFLVSTFDSTDETEYQNFFYRQSKIKKLSLLDNNLITFDHLQLEHLKISSNHDFVRMLTHQPRLRNIDLGKTWINDDVFAEVCKLKDLEVLKLRIDQIPRAIFRRLTELVKLRELRFCSYCPSDEVLLMELSVIKLFNLEKLSILMPRRGLRISAVILISMSENFHNLKHIEFGIQSIDIIGTILSHFRNLESLLLATVFGALDDVLEISDHLRHENLKQLVIKNMKCSEEDSRSMLKLVAACPNLERIMLPTLQSFTQENLKRILENHPNLTHLSLEFDALSFSSEVAWIIKHFGEKLSFLRLVGLDGLPRCSKLRSLFKQQFPHVHLCDLSIWYREVVMKKPGVGDWHLDFDLYKYF